MDREEVLHLYDTYSDDVYRLAYSFFLNPHDAERCRTRSISTSDVSQSYIDAG